MDVFNIHIAKFSHPSKPLWRENYSRPAPKVHQKDLAVFHYCSYISSSLSMARTLGYKREHKIHLKYTQAFREIRATLIGPLHEIPQLKEKHWRDRNVTDTSSAKWTTTAMGHPKDYLIQWKSSTITPPLQPPPPSLRRNSCV